MRGLVAPLMGHGNLSQGQQLNNILRNSSLYSIILFFLVLIFLCFAFKGYESFAYVYGFMFQRVVKHFKTCK